MSNQLVKYQVFWGYGPTTLDQWAMNAGDLQETLSQAAGQLVQDRSNLFIKTVQLGNYTKAKVSRRSKFKHDSSVVAALSAVENECEQFGIYIFDEAFSPVQEPEILMNFHSSRSGLISGKKLTLPDANTAGTFFICGASTLVAQSIAFPDFAAALCRKLNLGFSFLFSGVGYEYDGKTPLEWAYKNHSARLRSGRVEDIESTARGVRI